MATQKSFTPLEAEERFEKLPSEVKELLYSPQMRIIIKKIGDKNQLHIDQLGLLEAETGAAMLGFTETADLPQTLAESLRIEKIKADMIAKDIDDLLFSKIRDAMKKTYEMNATTPVVVTSPPVAMPSAPISSPSVAPKPSLVSVLPTASTPPAPPMSPKPPMPVPDMHQADVMLSEKTLQVAPASAKKPEPGAPGIYKKDPYREPTE